MIERQEVEALLASCEPGNEAFGRELDRMTRRKMRELCRAWRPVSPDLSARRRG